MNHALAGLFHGYYESTGSSVKENPSYYTVMKTRKWARWIETLFPSTTIPADHFINANFDGKQISNWDKAKHEVVIPKTLPQAKLSSNRIITEIERF